MTAQTIVLKAKLLAPPLPPGYVPRARLRDRLEPARALTLVMAPAGFGKTLAVTEWLAASSMPSGWLSLDEGDNDAARFFVHLVAALEQVRAGCCGDLGKAAADMADTDLPTLIAGVANALHAIEDPFYLVLDDYHVLETAAVHQAVGFLVEHMPPSMHLVITSRREPPLPLPRWRMRGRMTELHQDDLRFSSDEVSAFLVDTMGLSLDADQTRMLEKKTEGWIGGLQLAALSLVERADRDAFLADFAGDDRYVMDYLTVEVLAVQPPEVRSFLLRTSILERMNVPLCEAVSGQAGSAEILERLERERVFVVALDGKRQWYRYHHLFAGLLRHQLASSETESASACHLAASAWYEQAGDLAEAVRHARLANDPERIGVIVETHGLDLALRGRSKQVLVWVRQLSEDVLAANPRRLEAAMWCEYSRTGEVPASLRARIDAAIETGDAPQLATAVAVFEAYEAAREPARYREAIERANAIAPAEGKDHDFIRFGVDAIATACAHALGDVETAEAGYVRAIAQAEASHAVTMFMFMTSGHGRLRALQAGPAAARELLERARARAVEHGWDGLPISAAFRYAIARQLHEMGDLARAEAAYEEGISLAEHEPSTTRHPLYIGLARLQQAQGRADACDETLQRIEGERFIRPLMPMLPDMGVERAWIDLARGRLDAVQAFLESHGLEDGNGNATLTDIHGVHDDADLLVGRWLLLRQQYPRTIAVLTDALQAAVAGGRLDTVVRARIDLAVARHLEGERAQAFTQLDAAVDAALGRGYHQVFVEAPAQLRHLIAQRLADGVESEPARSFLEGLVAEAPSGSPTPAPVAEPLSPSERKVLEHLVGGLSNKEIAQALFISPNTVKTHIRRIYGKLGAKNRADAIRLARALA